jgi:4-hydroxy-tetrahydrodipicolinate synthase
VSFQGTYTALVTPFLADRSLDLETMARLIEWQIECGVDGLVPCGSTGESATLSPAEHVEVVRHVTDVVGGRVAVIAGTGSNSTREAIEFTAAAREAGADGALLISPYYNKPTQEGIYLHYRAVAEQGGHMEASAHTIEQSDPAFRVLSGNDSETLPLLSIGSHGSISTCANVVPRQTAELERAYRAGDVARARALHYELLPVMQALFFETNPIPVKTALYLIGRIPDATLRLPLTPMEKTNRDRLESALEGIERA